MPRWELITRAAVLAFGLISGAILAPEARAHGGLSLDQDTCVLRFAGGALRMHFTGYQPNSTQQEFCEDIPEPGRTIVVLDYIDPPLRKMTSELRVIRDTGDPAREAKNLDAITEVYLPPEKHPTGTFNFQHNFKEGKYVGIVTVRAGEQEHVSRFPFSVGGVVSSSNLSFYFLIPVALAVGAAGFWFTRGRGRTAS